MCLPWLREELVAFLEALPALPGTQTLHARPARIEHGPGRQPQFDEIVPVLFGKDEIVLAAIESPAEEGAAVVDRASRSAEIDALAVRLGGEQENRIPRRAIGHHAMPVRLDFVAPFRVEKKALITFAALGAAVAGHVRLSV